MLSGKISIGKFTVQKSSIMNEIIRNSEKNYQDKVKLNFVIPDNLEENLFDSIFRSISEISKQINAQAIVVFTNKGRAARRISKYKPDAKIIAISDSFATMNSLCLRWGVTSLLLKNLIRKILKLIKQKR